MSFRMLGPIAIVAFAAAWIPHPAAPFHQAVSYTAHMTAAAETPPSGVKGTGTTRLMLDGNHLTFTVDVNGLSGPPTAAHIHVGAVGVAGPPVYTIALEAKSTSGRIAHGAIDLTKEASAGVSGDSLKTLLRNGNAYVNVHTAAHPGGEIRGQVTKR